MQLFTILIHITQNILFYILLCILFGSKNILKDSSFKLSLELIILFLLSQKDEYHTSMNLPYIFFSYYYNFSDDVFKFKKGKTTL